MRSYYTVDPSSRLGKFLLCLFFAIGVIVLIVGVLLGVHHAKTTKNYLETTATMVDFDFDDHPVLEYSVGGQLYRTRSDTSTSSDHIGKTVKITYNPDNPSEIARAGLLGYLGTLVCGFIGVVFLAVSTLALLKTRKDRKEKQPRKKKKEEVPIWER